MDSLILSTCHAPNMDFLSRDLAGYLSNHLRIPVHLAIDISWEERDRLLDEGKIDLCWICGLPYVRKAERAPGAIVPIAAPVMTASRYGGQPIYFSDVVVHRDSPFQSLADLRGAVWAYNEPGSQSGYGVVRYALAARGETLGYFGRMVETGAHQTSLQMILRREVDASAIDSTVLEQELSDDPGIGARIRVIDTFGPSPIPPWVVSQHVSPTMREALWNILTGMDSQPDGKAILQKARIARFSPVSDRDYDPIREMARIGFANSI
ncbi:MAG TPA: PhnD/SsuA/transferrin family substrate-binding protein [Anaerolineaceae bacterium]|nr:PhnD/SsuA/transferrin family substrate-binding protein [Anaerolineaceae bacterium]